MPLTIKDLEKLVGDTAASQSSLTAALTKYIADTETLLEQARTAKSLLDQNPGLERLLITLTRLPGGALGTLGQYLNPSIGGGYNPSST